MSQVDSLESYTNLQHLIKRFEEHHSHICGYIEGSQRDAQFLCTSMTDILEAVAVIRQILERTDSTVGTDLADHLTEALKGITGDINRLRECHELRQHLRRLEDAFSLCHDEVKRPERLMDINIELVGLLWEKCKENFLEEVMQFMESVTFIKGYSSAQSGKSIEVENWIDDLRVMGDSIDGDLRELKLAPLKESTSRFSSLVNKYSTAADQHLEEIIAKLCKLVNTWEGSVTHLGQAPEGFQVASPATGRARCGRWASG